MRVQLRWRSNSKVQVLWSKGRVLHMRRRSAHPLRRRHTHELWRRRRRPHTATRRPGEELSHEMRGPSGEGIGRQPLNVRGAQAETMTTPRCCISGGLLGRLLIRLEHLQQPRALQSTCARASGRARRSRSTWVQTSPDCPTRSPGVRLRQHLRRHQRWRPCSTPKPRTDILRRGPSRSPCASEVQRIASLSCPKSIAPAESRRSTARHVSDGLPYPGDMDVVRPHLLFNYQASTRFRLIRACKSDGVAKHVAAPGPDYAGEGASLRRDRSPLDLAFLGDAVWELYAR